MCMYIYTDICVYMYIYIYIYMYMHRFLWFVSIADCMPGCVMQYSVMWCNLWNVLCFGLIKAYGNTNPLVSQERPWRRWGVGCWLSVGVSKKEVPQFMAMFKGRSFNDPFFKLCVLLVNVIHTRYPQQSSSSKTFVRVFFSCRDSWSQDSDCGVSIFSDYMRPQGHQAV